MKESAPDRSGQFRSLDRMRGIQIVRRFRRVVLTLLGITLPVLAVAENPPLSQEQLQAAPLIITGVVTSVSDQHGAERDCMTHHVVAIDMKGRDGRASNVRGFYDQWTCIEGKNGLPPPPPPVGHFGTWGIRSVAVGDQLKVYAGKDGDILEPNGIENVTK